ncbi:TlpA disulfide reductase family protein [Dissulfurimicrobium hydrothermale]|uniref:TlpA disulfide reductase family protein n=1 Tax=Dissulfurimicrobium hydrothermale TaxID=1750598 RepID=UPI001EDC7D9B|nr:TlpA disulfide reductase family protein [Dissulfurimicrobium hydrothermale]UKL14185.1 TlpA family protein disulfide reductase [Dissulfurimicrobium hydrothermale]
MKKISIKLLTVFFFLVAIVHVSACRGMANPVKAPDFTLLNLENKKVSLSDFKGKVVLLNFWATYCPPCRAEMPDFIALQNKYASKGFNVIGISVDEDWQEVLPSFVKAMKVNYPILIANTKVLKDYGDIYALPATFIIDREQKIVKSYTGMVTQDEIEPVILKALNQK